MTAIIRWHRALEPEVAADSERSPRRSASRRRFDLDQIPPQLRGRIADAIARLERVREAVQGAMEAEVGETPTRPRRRSHLKDPNMLPCPDNCGIFSGGQMKQGTTMESECTAFTVEVECLDKLKGLCKNSRDPGKCEAQVAKEKQLANDEKGIYCGRGT
jgi:hypothetical protein